MKGSCIPRSRRWSAIVSFALMTSVFAAPLRAQQPSQQSSSAPATVTEPTFETLLSADSYKLYGEVRNVGQLLTTGGAGEIIEPIVKLASPGPEFQSMLKFLKENAEGLATSRLLFAGWPARKDIPSALIAIEFANADEAAKFTPKLETFLPTVIPPVPVEEAKPTPTSSPQQAAPAEMSAGAAPPSRPIDVKPATPAAKPVASPNVETRLPFVITHAGSLVFISDKSFKFERLRPASAPLLSEDHNFRVARDRFSSEPVFVYFNVALEDKTAPKPSPTPVMSEEERERIQKEKEAEIQKEIEAAKAEEARNPSNAGNQATLGSPTLTIGVATPTPTPTKQQEAQANASNQVGSMFSILGQSKPQWPEAVGIALALDNDEYALRTILIEPQNSKHSILPFVPEIIAGPPLNSDAPSILPDDTEVLATSSIDFAATYQEMKRQAETARRARQTPVTGDTLDAFAEFEKKAGFKISDELLPVLGNEIAVATSLKTLNGVGIFGMQPPPSPAPKSTPDGTGANKQNPEQSFPIFLIGVKDREAAKRLMPRVLAGLGMGEANLLAQTMRRGDSDIVDYAGFFAYALVGNFLVISDSATVQRVADANTNHQTLSANNAFRTARHWQPRGTLGEVYISPALMESYQEAVRKQAGTMDPATRDFLMQLSPASSAITYALSHDGLGALHELHLPKNLILAMVASTSAAMSAMKQGSPEMNEMIAMSALQMVANAERTYKADKGSYGSIDNLAEQKLITKDILDAYGYRFEVTPSGNGFDAVAVPKEYGKTGKRSFYIDQSGVIRGDDHGGGPATAGDKPVNQ
jgi:hypothetical protein